MPKQVLNPHGRVKQLEHDSDSEKQNLGHDQGALHLYKTRQGIQTQQEEQGDKQGVYPT